MLTLVRSCCREPLHSPFDGVLVGLLSSTNTVRVAPVVSSIASVAGEAEEAAERKLFLHGGPFQGYVGDSRSQES